jgi:hypothetical protein
LNQREKRAVGKRMIKLMMAKKRTGKIKPGEEFVQFSGKHQRLLEAGAKRMHISKQEWGTRFLRSLLRAMETAAKNKRLARATVE